MPVKALVIGFGSIGKRHCKVLAAMGCHVAVVSRRTVPWKPCYSSVSEALQNEQPDYVVVASLTSEHEQDLNALAACGFSGKVLVEKPLFPNLKDVPTNSFRRLGIGYDMRFLPVMNRLKELLEQETAVFTVQAYVGQYLPDWRSNQDYRNSYSASKSKGGGVLRDLSHELDYLNWLFGGWEAVTAAGGRVSDLEIDSDDAWSIMLRMKKCSLVSLQINYLDRVPRRFLLVNLPNKTIYVDFIAGKLEINGQEEYWPISGDEAYRREHLAMLSSVQPEKVVCSLPEAIAVLEMIAAIENSAVTRSCIIR